MAPRKNFTATRAPSALAWMLALCLAGPAHAAEPVGTVTDLSGPLLVRKADGVVKVLSRKSTVDQGDTLVSEKDVYARIRFIDNSEITLRPDTQLKIENFSYEASKPENDSAIFKLFKGGLRSVTGLLGKRNTDRFALQTAVATIGIRGTIFIAEYVPQEPSGTASSRAHSVAALFPDRFDQMKPEGSELPGPLLLALQGGPTRSDALPDFRPQPIEPAMQVAQNVPPSTAGRSPGLYVQVLDGAIHLTNGGGTQNFTAGQFGFTPSFQQPPVILPTNPGMQFTPPPSFSSTTGSAGGTGAAKPGDVDCQVR